MSGMITMRTRKLWTSQLGMPRWSVGWWPTSAGKNTSFHGGLSSPRSNAFRFVPRTSGCWHSWVQVFPVPLEKKSWVPLSELSSLLVFFWQLQSQRHWHWWWHSAADKRFPECRPLWRPLVALRPEFHGSNVKPSGRLPSSRASPCASFMLGTPARVKARQMTAML